MALPILDGNQTAATLSTIITGGAHIPAHTVVSLGSQAISDITSAVSGASISIGSSVTVGGTVTANTAYATSVTGNAGLTPSVVTAMPVALVDRGVYGGSIMSYDGSNTSLNVNVKGSLPSISGTVTVSNFPETQRIGYLGPGGNTYVAYNQGLPVDIVSIQTNVNPLPISGTVTANNPSGALTTRFGSVTTANLAFITSAVTNTSRKYLLAQNISAGTVTIGIGFSPTTTQGIQLTAGGGLTFDAFCPTGAVYWLGAVTGAAFTILEG